ncbi:hypothetical protein SSX86_025744 [Deinandra increscens subsp. villosa]|uniref:AtPDCT1/2 transmembrane domain-containing protein n=1 Tax=Deinandra increscens subsp. villosa TaxID=3103831 RepID=A0AAP0CIH8_9ASTR
MNGDNLHHRSPPHTTTILKPSNNISINLKKTTPNHNLNNHVPAATSHRWPSFGDASFLQWTPADALGLLSHHPLPCFFAVLLLFFMCVEYTLRMIPSSSPPFDLGFVATGHLHRFLVARPALNTVLAGLNTVFVGMQTTYILGTWVIEGRPRATVAVLFMFTCRGILGYSTQLPLPEEFLGSGADFPVGNVSFFLFYSGHVAGSVIASLDMRRKRRWEMAFLFDTLNVLQVVRLLSTRGHYTIDLAIGVGAGILFDSLAGKYMNNAMISFQPTEISVSGRMAPTLLSPAAVNNHHLNPSILTATNPFLPSLHFFSSCGCSTSRIISSYRWSLLPPRNSKLRRRRCDAMSPRPPSPPEAGPPPDDDQSSNSGSVVSFSRFQEGVQIFCAVFFWLSLFFWSSVWDGKNNGRSNKGPKFWK